MESFKNIITRQSLNPSHNQSGHYLSPRPLPPGSLPHCIVGLALSLWTDHESKCPSHCLPATNSPSCPSLPWMCLFSCGSRGLEDQWDIMGYSSLKKERAEWQLTLAGLIIVYFLAAWDGVPQGDPVRCSAALVCFHSRPEPGSAEAEVPLLLTQLAQGARQGASAVWMILSVSPPWIHPRSEYCDDML